MGYSSRPMLTSKADDEQTLRWTAGPGGTATSYSAARVFNTGGMSGAKLRSANVFKGKAIMADFCEDPRLINGVHKNGVNVLYASYAREMDPARDVQERDVRSARTPPVRINGSPTQPNYTFAGDWFALGGCGRISIASSEVGQCCHDGGDGETASAGVGRQRSRAGRTPCRRRAASIGGRAGPGRPIAASLEDELPAGDPRVAAVAAPRLHRVR